MADRSPLLLAHAIAWPLASEDAYDCALTELRRDDLSRSSPTRTVSQGVEAYLRPRSRGDSLERIQRIRDVAWFGARGSAGPVQPLDKMLTRVACHFLRFSGTGFELHGGEGGPQEDGARREDASERVVAWRWFSLLFPSDYVVAAAASHKAAPLRSDRIVLLTPRLSALLRERGGAAETHMHLGAGMDFPTLWSTTMSNLTALPLSPIDSSPLRYDTETVSFRPFDCAGPGPGNSTSGLARLLVVAAWVRLVLADFVLSPRGTWNDHVASTMAEAVLPFGYAKRIEEGIRSVAPIEEVPLTVAQDALARTVTRLRTNRGRPPLSAADPLELYFPSEGDARTETLFARAVLERLASLDRGEPRKRQQLARVFWQYVRIRCAAYRLVVQEPGTAGLDWFGRHTRRTSFLRSFDNTSPASASMARRRSNMLARRVLVDAFTNQQSGLDLAAMEVRFDVPTHRTVLFRAAHALASLELPTRRTGSVGTEVGIVYHFKKRADPTNTRADRNDTRASDDAFRYRTFYAESSQRILALESALRACPAVVLVIRGVDVCSDELVLPTWVTAPVLHRARDASARAVAETVRDLDLPSDKIRPFGLTYHAGEDFRTPTEGLRRIAELDDCGLLRPGDRLGHAVALGTNIDRWFERNPRLYIPLSERLENVLWELELYCGPLAIESPSGRVARLIRIAEEILVRASFPAGITVSDLGEARRMRHQPDIFDRLRRWGFPGPIAASTRNASGALRALLRTVVREPGDLLDETEEIVVTEQDVTAAKILQHALRKRLARMEITVESNPTSNLLIGDLDTFDQHPAFVLQPLGHKPDDASLDVTINTDDPVNFSTRLADEYAYVYHALVRRGTSAADALAWLERSRSASVASRFTLAVSTDKDVMKMLRAQLENEMPELRAIGS